MNTPLYNEKFNENICLNCNSSLSEKYCTKCGQKRQERISFKYVKKEVWQMIRWFEMDVLKQLLQTMIAPGNAAYGFVIGKRKEYHHPLKLLLYCLGFYLILLNQSNFMRFSSDTQEAHIVTIIKKYANWSFSLGVFAAVFATYFAFYRKKYFNFYEHLILALYIQCVIILANGMNIAFSILLKNSPAFIQLKHASVYYMGIIEVFIVLLASWQFFRIDFRHYWYKYGLVVILYLLFKKIIIYGYAWLLLKGVKQGILT